MRLRNAFTRIELLMVIAITMSLAALPFPVFAGRHARALNAAFFGHAKEVRSTHLCSGPWLNLGVPLRRYPSPQMGEGSCAASVRMSDGNFCNKWVLAAPNLTTDPAFGFLTASSTMP